MGKVHRSNYPRNHKCKRAFSIFITADQVSSLQPESWSWISYFSSFLLSFHPTTFVVVILICILLWCTPNNARNKTILFISTAIHWRYGLLDHKTFTMFVDVTLRLLFGVFNNHKCHWWTVFRHTVILYFSPPTDYITTSEFITWIIKER